MKNFIFKKVLAFLLFALPSVLLAQGEFKTRWDLAGTTTLSFGTATSGPVAYSWQEELPGTASGSGTFSGNTLTITGLPSTKIILSISPTNFQRIKIGNQPVGSRLLDVKQWGTTTWTSMQDAFFGCSNLNITATDIPNLSLVKKADQMFQSCAKLTGPANINSWNVSTIETTTSMFNGCKLFNQNIGSWNTANVLGMRNMFAGAGSFNQNIGGWNTAKVYDMRGTFRVATSFNQNISGWKTAGVTMMEGMFEYATSFNQNIGIWSLNANVNLTGMLNNSGMDCSNYAATLVGWNANPSCPTGRTLGATGRTYGPTAAAARANLVSSKGWTIAGDGSCSTARMNVNTVTDLFNVKAFPNPFASHFSLDIESSSDAPVQVKVYDMIGRQLEANQANVSELSTREIGRNYPSGVYTILVSQGEKVKSLRMVKK
jgi:surface protein